ncbi:MAG TPA: hypothetical protein VFN35_34995 [Ktedonobacteraceae bacterium]|nr:hypothetical protein [Ktedonobacteraceae bacterium]
MEKRLRGSPYSETITPSTQIVFAPSEVLAAGKRLVVDVETRTVLLLTSEDANTVFRTFLLPPTGAPLFLTLLQHYPHPCSHRELFTALYPHSRSMNEQAWNQERGRALPQIRRALKSLLPVLRGCELQALALRGQGYVLAPLVPTQEHFVETQKERVLS